MVGGFLAYRGRLQKSHLLAVLLVPELFGLGTPAGGVGLAFAAQVLHALGRFEVGRVRAGARDHLGKQLRVFEHRAGTQVVTVEGLTLAVFEEERLLQALEETLLTDVRARVMDKDAGLHVARGVDVAVDAPTGNAAAGELAVGEEAGVGAELLGLGQHTIHFFKGEILVVAVFRRPAALAAHVACARRIHQDKPGNVAAILFGVFCACWKPRKPPS